MLRTTLTLSLVLLLGACPAEPGAPDGGTRDGGADAGSDGGEDGGAACSLADHTGCAADELCCDAGGVLTCVPSTFQQCGACGEACDPAAATTCEDRVCGCGSNLACEGATPRCDPTDGRCVACLGSADCPGQRCVDEVCRDCDPADAAGCGGTTPICDAATFSCQACTQSPDNCPAPLVCTAQGFCGGCDPASHTGCATSTAPVCDAASTVCRGCADDPECSAEFGLATCLGDGRCAECEPAGVDAHRGCTEAAPVCTEDPSTGIACGPCSVNTDCDAFPATPVCATGAPVTGSCVACEFGQTEACAGTTPFCDFASGQCVADCSSYLHCAGVTPICDAGSCRGCQGDDECAMIPGKNSCGGGACF